MQKLTLAIQMAFMAITMLAGLFFGWLCLWIAIGLPVTQLAYIVSAVLAALSMVGWLLWMYYFGNPDD